MACEECRELETHAFRTPDDLIHALRLVAEEMNRGVLVRVDRAVPGVAEQEAIDSSLASGAMPRGLAYRFRCAVCGDEFMLEADPSTGEGGWRRL